MILPQASMPFQQVRPPLPPPVSTSYSSMCNLLFYLSLFCVEGAIIGLYALIAYETFTGFTQNGWGTYDTFTGTNAFNIYVRNDPIGNLLNFHTNLVDQYVFMLIGFAFLIVFLRFHRWMSLAMTFFACALAIQLTILWTIFFLNVYNTNYICRFNWTNPYLTTNDFTTFFTYFTYGVRGAVAVLITLGALIGKIDAFQVLIIVIIEVIIFTANEMICCRIIHCRDMGGCFYIHAFGSMTGIIASWIYTQKSNCKNNPNINGSYFSSTSTFIGTFFLWVTFPAFNTFNPSIDYATPWSSYILGMENTFFALTASTISAMWMSLILYNGKFNWEGVCFATLAGGIIISGSCDMFAYPWPPLLIGCFGGIFSMICFAYLRQFLEKIFIYDTRGILELHYISSLLGMAVAASQATFLDRQSYFSLWWVSQTLSYLTPLYMFNTSGSYLGAMELFAFLISSGLGIGTGIVIGIVLRFWRIYSLPEDTFGDHIWWKMVQDETNLAEINDVPPLSNVSVMNPRVISPRKISPRIISPRNVTEFPITNVGAQVY